VQHDTERSRDIELLPDSNRHIRHIDQIRGQAGIQEVARIVSLRILNRFHIVWKLSPDTIGGMFPERHQRYLIPQATRGATALRILGVICLVTISAAVAVAMTLAVIWLFWP
jgi:hypothetical protein